MTASSVDPRAKLEAERERITASIANLHDESGKNPDDEVGALGGIGADNAAVILAREIGEGLEEGAQETLAQIERAIARLDEGTYGTCERCGKPIGEERLDVRPWATLCIDDQRLADRG